MNRDLVKQVLREYGALRRPDTEPELEAVRAAIMLEDVFGVALSDVEIDPAVLADSAAMADLIARLRGGA